MMKFKGSSGLFSVRSEHDDVQDFSMGASISINE